MAKNKKFKFPKMFLVISAIIVIYLKIRDYLLVGSLSCGLGFNPCSSFARFFLEFLLWVITVFLILFLIKFFVKMIFSPSKYTKKKLILKTANDQAAKVKKKKKKAKKKKEKVKEEVEEDEPADVDDLDENDTWDEVEVEAEKKDEEVIRI